MCTFRGNCKASRVLVTKNCFCKAERRNPKCRADSHVLNLDMHDVAVALHAEDNKKETSRPTLQAEAAVVYWDLRNKG